MSRMKPGARVHPHQDLAVYYSMFHRCQVCLKAEEQTVFTCVGENLVMKPGEVWVFDNMLEHSVTHDGNEERIALVVDVKTTYVF